MDVKVGNKYRLKKDLNEKFNTVVGEVVKVRHIGYTMTEFQSVNTGYFGIVPHNEVDNYLEEVV